MILLKESDFRKEIKESPRTGYLFFGEEDYLKSFAVRSAREAICPDPAFSFFNDFRLEALDFDTHKLLDAIMPMPMMADRKLITVSGLNLTTMRQNEFDDLCEALSELKQYDYNTLILTLASDCFNPGYLPKKPSAQLTQLAEYLTPVQFERCSTAKLTAWIQKHFQHNGVTASPALCGEMAEYCGHSMYLLANEIDKLSFYLRYHGQTEASADAMRLVCSPTAEYDAFAFTNAVTEGKSDAALAILAEYKFRKVDPIAILGDVVRVICDMISVRSMTTEGLPATEIAAALKLHEYKVGLYQKSLRQTSEERLRRALDACVSADAALKLSPQGYTALEKLICTL